MRPDPRQHQCPLADTECRGGTRIGQSTVRKEPTNASRVEFNPGGGLHSRSVRSVSPRENSCPRFASSHEQEVPASFDQLARSLKPGGAGGGGLDKQEGWWALGLAALFELMAKAYRQ